MSDPAGQDQHGRHYTREEATAMLPKLEPMLVALREAKDQLTDEEAHRLLSDAAPGNGGGDAGHQVGTAFLEVRRILDDLEETGVVVRDIDRGLVDFPSHMDGREVYLCWELGEDSIGFWHDLDSGYGGRQPLD